MSFNNSAQAGNISASPPHDIMRTPFCVWVCTEMIRHCYPTAAVHRLPFSIHPPVVCHHFHPIITPPPPGSLLWLLSKWDHRRSVNTQVCDHSHILCSVAVCVSAQPCFHVSFMCPHPSITSTCWKSVQKRGLFITENICCTWFWARVHVFSTKKKTRLF